MTNRIITLSTFLGTLLSSAILLAQPPQVVTTTHYPAHPLPGVTPSGPMMPMPLVAPIIFQNASMSSSLVLVNAATANTNVAVTVRDLAGAQLVQQHIVVEHDSRLSIPLDSLLAGSTESVEVGSLSVMQETNTDGMAVAAQIAVTDHRNSLPAYLDEELAMPSMQGSTILRAVVGHSDAGTLLAITNIGESTQHATLKCLREGDTEQVQVLTIAPNATSLSIGCSSRQLSSFSEYLEVLKPTAVSTQAFEVTGDGMSGTLAAFAIAPHKRTDDIVFSSVPFSDPQLALSSQTIYVGVPFGSQSTISDGMYIPHISLANFSPSPAHITVSEASSNESEPDDVGVHAAAQMRILRQITLRPGQSSEVILQEAGEQSGLLHSVLINSDLKPGLVQSKLVSRGDGSLFEVELLGKDAKDQENGGGHPWSTDGSTASNLFLFNHTANSVPFYVHISDGVTIWNKKYDLAPSQTRELSVNAVISEQIKDDQGRTLNPDANYGVVYWSTPDAKEGTGRLLVSDRTTAMARNFSCGYTYIVCGLDLSVFDYGVVPVDGNITYGDAAPQWCLTWAPGYCNGGTQTSGGGGASFNWSIGNTGIVNFSDGSQQYYERPSMTGVTAGSTSSYVTVSANGCGSGGGGSPPPTSCDFKITPDSSQGGAFNANDCTNGTRQTATFGATISPSASACSYNATLSSCSNVVTDGNVDYVLNSLNCSLQYSQAAQLQYIAGPPLAGQGKLAGDIKFSFSLDLGGTVVTHTTIPDVYCP